MKNLLILLVLMLMSPFLKSQVSYPFTRLEDYAKEKRKLEFSEDRSSPNDSFKTVYSINRLFSSSCVLQRFAFNFREDFNGGVIKEYARDSFIYENGLLKYIDYNSPAYDVILRGIISKSKDAKTDTTFFTKKGETLAESVKRTILYRNQKGLDSAFINQFLTNGVWKTMEDYFDVIYDSQMRVTQVRTFNIINNSILKNQVIGYLYANNNLISKVDTLFTSLNNVDIASSIIKTDYTYNSKGVVTEELNSEWDIRRATQPSSVLTPYAKIRNTSFNTKDKPTIQFIDRWINGGWSEVNRVEMSYVNDLFLVKSNTYSKANDTWWLRIRRVFDYCGLVNAVNEVSQFDFNISPNPTQSTLNISRDEIVDSNNRLLVFNSAGVQVLQNNNVSLPNSIDVSSFTEGMYFMKFIDSKGVSKIKKFVVVR